MFYIPQLTSSDCGLACIKMLLANLNSDENYLFLQSDENHGSYSFEELIDISRQHGCNLLPVEVEDKTEFKKNKKFPFVAVIKLSNEALHCVLVTKCKFGRVKILDPDLGTYSLSFSKFFKLWTGKGLLLDNYQKKKCEFKLEKPIKAFDYALSMILQFIGSALLVLGLYFLDGKNKPYIPIMFVCGFAVFEIAFRLHNIYVMKKIDDSQKYPKDGKYREHFVRFETYKKNALLNPMNSVFAMLVILFVIVVLILNSTMNFIIVLVPLFISLIDVVLIKPKADQKENSIKLLELALDKCRDKYDYQVEMQKIHGEAYTLAKLLLLKKYLYVFIMIISSLLVMFMANTVLLPYAAFYVLIQYLLYENISLLFNYSKRRNDFLRSKALFINCQKQYDEK